MERTKYDKPREWTLRDVLSMMECAEPLPDTWKEWDCIIPESVQRVEICFMSEDETHITTYPHHPILIPWYRCKVNSFAPSDENTLMIWLDYQNFLHEALSERKAEKEENR